MADREIEAMSVINEALSKVDDAQTRARILRWAVERFGPIGGGLPGTAAASARPQLGDDEIPGIAKIDKEGKFHLTVRDLKAKGTIDAAMRLVHIAVRAHGLLSGEREVSSKNVVLPLLKSWRVYDGNTRAAIARHKGIVRSGDMLQLDVHAEKDADKYIADTLDADVQGSWKPTARLKKKNRAESST